MATDKYNDDAFDEATTNATKSSYLGNHEVVQAVLLNHCLAIEDDSTPEAIDRVCKNFSDTMLGNDPQYAPVPGWNVPGKIDVFCAEELHLGDDNPEDTMRHVLLRFVRDVMEANQDPNLKDDDAHNTFEPLVERYAYALQGVAMSTRLASTGDA